jgi:cytochrome c biogenesis protein CcmG/thiol:disulfide interchange protein DsbE
MTELTDYPTDYPADAPAETVPAAAPSPARSVRFWQGVIVLILLAFVIMLGAQLWRTNANEQRAAGAAPSFTFTTFDGETISLEDLRGKGVVLNFWASWCEPCREEAVLLEATWQREKDNGIVFIGLDYLDQAPAALDYARRYRIQGVPETFFIDPQGNISGLPKIGPFLSEAELNERIDAIRP